MEKIYSRIKKFNDGLLPEIVNLKFQLMSENSFRFFRGTCHIFYEDLKKAKDFPKAPIVLTCGDLHMENFGSFKGDNRMVYFDLNDFDESIIAPATWDIVRMLTSIFVAFDTLKSDDPEEIANLFLKTYVQVLTGGKSYYIDPRTAKGSIKKFMKIVEKRKTPNLIQQIRDNKSSKLKIEIDYQRHLPIEKHLKRRLINHMNEWLKQNFGKRKCYVVEDVAFRIAGTGSLGLKRYMFLLSKKNCEKSFVVDMKEIRQSSLAPYISSEQPMWGSQVARVIGIQSQMQNLPPALLREIDFEGETYLLQEMQPTADKLRFPIIYNNDKDLRSVVKSMAMLTASAQIRGCGLKVSSTIDDLIVFGQCSEWQSIILNYAREYSKRVQMYYKSFLMDYHKKLDEQTT